MSQIDDFLDGKPAAPAASKVSAIDAFLGPEKDATLGERVGFGFKRALSATQTALTDDPTKIAKQVAETAAEAPRQSAAAAQMQADIKPYVEAANKAEGVVDTVKGYGILAAKRAGQLISNPGEAGKMIAEQLPNSLPGMAGGIAGAKGGAALGSVFGPVGTAAGAVIGGVAGGLAGGYLTEKGSSVQEQVQKKAQEAGVNIQDQRAVSELVRNNQPEIDSAAALKGLGTAGTDAVLNVLTVGLSGMGRRMLGNEIGALAGAVKAGQVTAADAAKQLAGLEAKAVAQGGWKQVLGRGAAVTTAEMLGEGASEAVGQKLAYGSVDAGEVVDESLLGLGQGVGMAAASGAYNKLAGTPDQNTNLQRIEALRNAIGTPTAGEAGTDTGTGAPPPATEQPPAPFVNPASLTGNNAAAMLGSQGAGLTGAADPLRAVVTPSQAMGIDPNAGAISRVAAEAVDGPASMEMAVRQAERDMAALAAEDNPEAGADPLTAAPDPLIAQVAGYVGEMGTASPQMVAAKFGVTTQRAAELLAQADPTVDDLFPPPQGAANVSNIDAAGALAAGVGGPVGVDAAGSGPDAGLLAPATGQRTAGTAGTPAPSVQESVAAPVPGRDSDAALTQPKTKNLKDAIARRKAEKANVQDQPQGTAPAAAPAPAEAVQAPQAVGGDGAAQPGAAPAGNAGVEAAGVVPASTDATGKPASWVIRNKDTGEVVMETFDRAKVQALNTAKYEAVPVQQYLGGLNKKPTTAATEPTTPAENAVESEKAKWIKATIDKSRLNGAGGVQIAVAPNGGITFMGDPRSNKDGKALLANYEQALAAGATQKEIAEALKASKSAPTPSPTTTEPTDAPRSPAPAQAVETTPQGREETALLSDSVKPAGKYQLPEGRVSDSWRDSKKRGTDHPDYEPTPRQQVLMDEVAKAKDAGAFYANDVKDAVAKALGVDAETLAANTTGVEGGDFGMDVYLAGRALDAKRKNAREREIAKELSLKPGDKLGTLVFNDMKVTNSVEVESVSDDGLSFNFKGKRGPVGVKFSTGPVNVKGAIERAHEKGKRKDTYEQFIEARKAPAAPSVAAPAPAEPQETTHNGTRIYRTRAKLGDEVKTMWAVETPENKARRAAGERALGGDTLHDTIEQAKTAADREAKQYADRKAFADQQDAEERARKEADETRKAANRGKSIAERRKETVLDGQTKLPASAGLGNTTRRNAMQMAVEQGRAVVERQVDDTAAKKRDQEAIERVRSAGYMLGLSNENIPVVKAGLEAQARLKANDYKKPEYRVYAGSEPSGGFFEITKIEYEYAQELMAQKAAKPAVAPAPEPATQADEFLPEGWTKSINGYTKRPVYRMEQGGGQPFAVVTQTEGMTYEVQIRHGDKQLTTSTQRGALSEVLASAKAELAKMTQAASVTHQDPGEKPEAATKGVVNDSLKTAAKNEDTKPSEMRKWLLAEIDKELLQAPDRADYDEAVKRLGEKDAISMYTGNGFLGKNAETGFITFDVPGDGKFKVRNSVRGLLEFRKTVNSSLGFKDGGQKTLKPEQNDGVQGGSGGQMAAVTNMIEEGDFEAARDYAEAVGIKLEDVKVPRGDMKPAWDKFLKDGTLPPAAWMPSKEWQFADIGASSFVPDSEKRSATLTRVADGSTYVATVKGNLEGTSASYTVTKDGKEIGRTSSRRPFSDTLRMAEDAMPEANDKPAPSKASDTGWNMAGTGYGGKRYTGRNITLADGREVVARIYENAGTYEEAEVKEGSKVLLRLTDRYRAQERVDAWLDRLMGKTPALDLMGFKMEPMDDDGSFRLLDGNMVVSVERTDTGLQARHRSAKSSPRLTDQQAVEWAANIRDESKKAQAAPAAQPAIPDGYKPAGEPFYRDGELTQGYAPFDLGQRVTMKESGGQSGVIDLFTSPDKNGVFDGAMVKFDNGVEQIVKLNKLEAEAAPAATGTRRDPTKVSMFNPYNDGDIVTIDGQDWTVKADTPGWYLTTTGNWRGQHPTIRNVKAMADLIREVEQAAEAKPAAAQAETPKLTQAEAKDLMEWQDLGQKDGIKTHILTFYESKADKDAKRGRMVMATVTKEADSKNWVVEGTDDRLAMLAMAKKKAEDAGMARAVADGFVEAAAAVPEAPKKGLAGARAKKAAEAEAQRAAYFTPGNVVKGYGGHDRVLEYTPVDERGTWSVRVQRVMPKDGKWVDAPNERPRWHSTQPEAKELAAGPVVKAPASDPMGKYDAEARAYGYQVAPDGKISKGDKALSPVVKEVRGRLRVEAPDGKLLFSGATTPEAFGEFLRSFWGAEKTAQTTNDRDTFTLERLNPETDRMEPVTFQRGETVKIAAGQRPYPTGVITGISHAERKFRVDGNEYGHDFGYAYKADFDELARPRQEVDASLNTLEQRLNEGNAIQSEGFIRSAKEVIERNNLGDYAKDRMAQLARRAADVSKSVLDKMRAAKAEKEQADAQKRAEDQAKAAEPKPPIEMTMDEWKAVSKDFKGMIDGKRTVMRDGGMRFVTIIPSKAAESKTPTIDAHNATMAAVREGKATAEQFKTSFEAVVAGKEAIKAELDTMTKVQLLREGGPFVQMRYANEKKGEVVDAVYRQLVGEYALGETVSYGMGKGAYEAAIRRMVEAADDAKLAAYAVERKAAMEEAKANRAARAAAIENPQTLADYREAINVKVREGMTRKEAFLTLTPEQRIKYDTLEAEGTREAREARKRALKTQVRAAGQSTGGQIIATKHTKNGYDLFVVQLSDRLSREDYQTVLASAKKLGGWYSAFRGNGAVPGFQFKDRANADAFLALAGGDTAAAQEQVAQRRDAFEDDRSQTAVERLRAMADKLEAQAAEVEGRERKTNTARRARFASAALNAAAADKAKAKTMRNIADGIEAGKAKFLDEVRTKSQVDMLTTIVETAKFNELRAKYPSYADHEKRKGEPPTAETADFAEFPSYSAFRSDLATLGRQLLEVDGTKKLGQRLMSVADDVTDAYLEFAKANFRDVSQFGRGDSLADFASKDEAERAIKRSGLTGKAIVLPLKRGQNRVILSPSEAIGRGVWQGDGDKRITLTVDFGNELVEAIGRRGNKANRLTVPWQFHSAYDRRKALARIGIETPSEFRSALREFIDLKEQAVANRTRELELQMVGRKADGLDFFPTSAEVADQMVEAADLTPDMAVLEPSAGMGHLADRIREAGAEPDVIEISPDRRELLEEKGYHLAEVDDFMLMEPRKFFTYGDVFRASDGTEGIMRGGNSSMGSDRVMLVGEDGRGVGAGFYNRSELVGVRHRGSESGYDRIIMNPPFSNRRDADHVRHAYDLLKPGGRIVAIMGEGVFFGQDKKAQDFRDWLDSVEGTSEKLPSGSFMDPSLPVNTAVNARMVVIDKPVDAPAFSRSNTAKQGITNQTAEQIVGVITSRWANAPEVVVVESVQDPKVPAAVRRADAAQRSQGATGEPEGFWYGGKAYIVSGALNRPVDVVRVLFHEVLGHYGLRGTFGADLKPILAQIATMRKSEVQAKATEYGLDMAIEADRLEAAEEVLAVMAQSNPQAGFVKRAIGAIRAWLRENIPGLENMRLTDNDIVTQFILPARRFVQQGPAARVGDGVLAMSRSAGDVTDTPAFRKWFGDSKVVDADGKPLVVYHGTASDFSVFDKSKSGANWRQGEGAFFFTSRQRTAGNYATRGGEGANVMPVYLSITNPLMRSALDPIDHYDISVKPEREALEAQGYDGVIVRSADGGGDLYVAFHPEQIKSAIGNNGQFDPENPDIRFSRSPRELAGMATDQLNTALKSVTITSIKQAAGYKATDLMGIALGALGRRQLVEIYGKDLPLDKYNELATQMEADKNEYGAEADTIATEWGKLKDEGALANIMHDATLAKIDPDKPLQPGDDPAAYNALKMRFSLMSKEAKETYRKARDGYKRHHANVREAIKERIERSQMSPERRAALIERMDSEFFAAMKGVYFPLARFGKYVVVVRGADGKVETVARSETMAEAAALRRNLVAGFPASKGYQVDKVILSREFVASRDAVGRGFMQELYQALDKQDMDPAMRAEMEDTLGQLYLSSLPDVSWAKHGIHRKGTPGFSQDARRAFAQNMFHGARYLAKLRYSDLMQTELKAMQDHVDKIGNVLPEEDGFNGPRMQRVVDEFYKRHDSLMNPSSHPLSTALTSIGFMFHLGLSPASALVNLTQTAFVAYPVMAAKWGFGKAGVALLKASKQAAMGRNDITKFLNRDERRAYDEAVRAGTIDVTMAHDLAGIAQGEDAGVMWRIRPAMRAASFLFHHAERFNRQATFVAAYRLAREAGAAHEAAFEQATKATYDGHFDYSAGNRPRFMQGNAAKVILLFKSYAQNMVYTLARNAYQSVNSLDPKDRAEARKALAGILATHAMAAGVLGLPMVTTILAAISAAGSDDDEPFDAQVALQNMLADTFGQKPAEVITRGLSRLTPWDISGRVGLDRLIFPDVQEGLEGQRLAESAAFAALGPVAGIGLNILKGIQEIGDGHMLRGITTMMPAALRGPLNAVRLSEEGAQDKTGIPIVDEVDAAAVFGQALGFSPSVVRQATEGKRAVLSYDRALNERRQELMTQYARGAMKKDAEAMQEAREAIQAFNEKNPGRRITMMQLNQSVRNRERRIDQADNGVYLPKNRREAMDQGRFALSD